MKSAKGFGKNYFTLNAICALNSTLNIAKESQRVHEHLVALHVEDEDKELLDEDSLLQEPLSTLSYQSSSISSYPSTCKLPQHILFYPHFIKDNQ